MSQFPLPWVTSPQPDDYHARLMSPARTSSKLIPIGWIGGAGVSSQSSAINRFYEAVAKQSRGQVVALFADCREDADRMAGQCGGQLYRSLRSFCQHERLGAILCLEMGWFGDWGIEQIRQLGVPTLVGNPLGATFSHRVIERLAAEEREGCLLIPAATWRFTPATLRLRELLATRLGPLRQVVIRLRSASRNSPAVLQAIDWCRTLLVPSGGELHWQGQTVSRGYGFTGSGRSLTSPSVVVQIESASEPPRESEAAAVCFEAQLEAERGEAIVRGDSRIEWSCGSDTQAESLESDRTAEQVMLDLFLRRVVGGLVPAPSWGDLQHVVALWHAANEGADG